MGAFIEIETKLMSGKGIPTWWAVVALRNIDSNAISRKEGIKSYRMTGTKKETATTRARASGRRGNKYGLQRVPWGEQKVELHALWDAQGSRLQEKTWIAGCAILV